MATPKEKKPAKVGQWNPLIGILICFGTIFLTFAAFFGSQGLFPAILQLLKLHPFFGVVLVASGLFGGVGIGRLLGGGVKIGDTTSLTEFDKV